MRKGQSKKSRLGLGLIILIPLCVLLYLVILVLKIGAGLSHGIFWKFIAEIPWPLEGIFTIILVFLLAWGLGSLYFSKRTRWLTGFIDKLIGSLPIIKFFWHSSSVEDEELFDLSKMKGAFIEVSAGIWILVFMMNKHKIKNGRVLTTVLWPTYPLPLTGTVFLIDEEELRSKDKIRYLATSPSQLSQIHLSFGLRSKELEFEDYS
jgi:uncharacterized membrane protein